MFTTKMRTAAAGTVLATAIGIGGGVWPAMASAAPSTHAATNHGVRAAATSLPVQGQLPDGSAFAGTIKNLRVTRSASGLTVSGIITGTGLPAGGTAFSAPIQAINGHSLTTSSATRAAAAQAATGCSVLKLTLGPLHLDLLGLVIDLNQVNLDITAVPGAGNLLGNLLCAVTHLLDNTGAGGLLAGLTGLLNNLLSALGLGPI